MGKNSKLLSKKSKRYFAPEEEKSRRMKEIIDEIILQGKECRDLEKEAKNNKFIKGFFIGNYSDDKLYYYIKGLKVLQMVINGGLDAYEFYLVHENNVNNVNKKQLTRQALTTLSRKIANDSINILVDKLNGEYEKSKNIYMFEQMCKFVGEGRDIITEERQIDGVNIQQKMTVREIFGNLQSLIDTMDIIERDTIDLYTSIGSDVIGFIGAMTQFAKESKTDAILMGTLSGLNRIKNVVDTCKYSRGIDELFEKRVELRHEARRGEEKFLSITPTNKDDLEKAKKNAIDTRQALLDWDFKIDNYRNRDNLKSNSIFLAMMGVISVSEINKYKDNLNPSTMSKIMLSIMNKKKFLSLGSKTSKQMDKVQSWNKRYKEDLKRVLDMAKQIEEKSNALSTPKVNVKSVSFKNFKGEFYKTQIQDKVIPECVINIPSMKAEIGQSVLVTGNSGSGKSTILKFLRDGDIENKGQIIINDSERVDKLGTDIVSMCEAKMSLCSYNILQDITGKTKQKDLSESERIKLEEIFRDLGLMQQTTELKDNFINKCEYKTYEQFSTGQQKRLELAKVLFAINDNSQVILLDETVSNVQKELGEGAFKLINKYTKRGAPKIVIMVSHDIETASKYADKRYHINEEGTMEEIQLKRKIIEDGPEI